MGQMMPNWLTKRAYLTPKRTAIVFNGQSITFGELYEKSIETAGKLTAAGVKQKQFAGLLLRNHLDSAVILLALHLIGVRAVILNNRLSAEEISWQLKDSSSLFLISEEFFYEKIEKVQNSKLPNLEIIEKEALFQGPYKEPVVQDEIDLNDICTIMYTSGTTGHPKGVIQTFGNHWWSATGSALNLGLHEEDCWLLTVPLFHISGYSILMKCIIYGMKIVLHEKFDVEKVIEDFHKERVTIMSVVSTTLHRIIDCLENEKLPDHVRCMLLGGGPASQSLLDACVEKGIPVFQTYGMTETSSQIVTLAPEDSLRKLGSAGKPLFPSQIKIVTENGREASAGVAGEIIVKGPNVTRGYLNRNDQQENGWLPTGDIGYLDEEGFLFVLDRRSDLIISGGENVYPAEIEGVLTSHSHIEDAGVIGVKDERWGEVPVAFIVKKSSVSTEEIIEYCMGKLAKFKVPQRIYFTNKIPRNASKKILRRELRSKLNEEGEIRKDGEAIDLSR